MQNQANISLPF